MKTFQFNREFFVSQKLLGPLACFSFLIFVPKSFSKIASKGVSFSQENSKMLSSSIRSAQSEVVQATSTENTSIILKVLAGIGTFFAVVGKGIGKGITETVKFIGRVITFPVTATYSLFVRKESNSGEKGSTNGNPSSG